VLDGREVLVDPGFFCYNGDPAWEVHFRRTLAHNTVQVDGRDQAHHVSKMVWTHTYAACLEASSHQEPFGWARGSHDGYARQPLGVTHRRTVWLRPEGYVVICDELSGAPGHTATAVFQFAGGSLAVDRARSIFEDRFELAWACSAPVAVRAATGGPDPADGWIAESLGVRRPAPRLTLDVQLRESRTVLLTVLADRHRGGRAAPRVVAETSTPIGDLVLHVTCPGSIDSVAAGVWGSPALEGVETDAPLVIARRSGGALVDVAQAGGTWARPSHRSPRPGHPAAAQAGSRVPEVSPG
jgi:hypothetical protein